MIRSLQRRFVLTAMLSLFVLLLILIGGIIGASYIAMERSTDQALERFISGTPPPPPKDSDRLPFFGYQIIPNSPAFLNYSIVIVDTKREVISIDSRLNSIDENTEIQEFALSVLENAKEKGKIGSFKYVVTKLNNGNSRIVFLDVSAQAQMLVGTARVSSLIGLACMILMFVILILVSRRTVQPIANSIEKQQRFVTDAGHEIKTPLAIIQANVDAMELHIDSNKWSKHIREQTVRLDGLMKQLLSLSQMDEGATIDFEETNFSSLVEKYVSTYSETSPDKEIVANIAPHVMLYGNRESLERLVIILLDNAVKHSGNAGVIHIKLDSFGRKKVLEITNSCPSLPDANPQTLFDRFYRADTARTQRNGGYGIGLSIARAITELHKGRISAAYDDEHTIRFRVEL